MDSVVFEGKEYTKASVLAEKFRYTPDYLGQLCRAKKVDARLVGRAWYINLDSLMTHKESRYKTESSASSEISPKKQINHYLSRIDVEPILKKKTVKIFANTNGQVSELPVKYEPDEYALIPKIHKEAVSVSLPVNPAEAEALRVKKVTNEEVSFKPEALPEVYLRGTISVAGLAEPTEAPMKEETERKKETVRVAPPQIAKDETTAFKVSLTKEGNLSKVTVRPKTVMVRPIRRSTAVTKPTSASIVPAAKAASAPPLTSQKPAVEAMKSTSSVPVSSIKNPAITPPQLQNASVLATKTAVPTSFTPTLVVQKLPEPVGIIPIFSGIVVPVSLLFMAIGVGLLILATNSETLASGASYKDRFVVQNANLVSLYKELTE